MVKELKLGITRVVEKRAAEEAVRESGEGYPTVYSLRTPTDLGPGDHLCCLYEKEEEHRAVLTPFLRQGLERGEKVLYIVDAHTAETVLGYLRDDGLEVEPYLASGQLSILTVDDAYMREGVFDPDGMIALLRAETERALAEGYSALRVTGEMTWALRGLPGSERLIEYEAKLNEFFPGSKCLAICQYDRRRFDPEVLLDVLSTHPLAVIGTEVYDNFYYIPPAEFLGRDRLVVELSRWVQNLAERKRAEEALRESEERYRHLVELSPDTIAIHSEGKIVFINSAGAKLLGAANPEQIIGKPIMDFLHPDYRDIIKDRVRQIGEEGKEAPLIEEKFIRLDGTVIDAEVAAIPSTYQGKPVVQAVVRDITERKRAEEEIRRRSEELAALNAIAQTVSQSLNLETVLDTALEKVVEVLNFDAGGAIHLVDEREGVLVPYTIVGQPKEVLQKMSRFEVGEGMTGKAALLGEVQLVEDTLADARLTDPTSIRLLKELGVRSFANVPLETKGKVWGVMGIGSREPRCLTSAEVGLLTSIGSQIGVAIENARLYEATQQELAERKRAEEEIRRRSEELATLNAIAMAVTSTLDLQGVLQAIQERVMSLLGEKYPPFFSLFNEENQTIEVVVTGKPKKILERAEKLVGVKFEELIFPLSTVNPAVREALLAGKPYVTDDVSDLLGPGVSRRLVQSAQSALGVKCIVDLPLSVKGKFIGLMALLSQKENISDEEMELLSSIARQAAIAIENARLYEEAHARSAYLETLLRINATLRSTLPLSQVLETIVQGTAEALDYVGSLITVPDATGERLVLGTVWGSRFLDAAVRLTGFKVESFGLSLEAEENPIVRAYLTGELQASIGAPERIVVGIEPPISPKLALVIERTMGAKLAACVPLRAAEKTVGVLSVFSPREQLPDEERAMLLGLADQAGLAIQNARLYEETQRHLEQVTALREIDKAISSTLDLPEVLVIILEQLERLVPYHSAAVYLLTDDTAKMTAASGVPDLDRAMQVSFQVSEDALVRQLLEDRRPLVLADAQTDERFQARGGAEYVRSWIGVPLIVREEMIGFLTIDHREPGVYDEESGETALSFANQVAIAIENAQAYERLKTQNLETISALAATVEAKDPYTSGHSEKVTEYAMAIAQELGLSPEEIEHLRMAGLLHDVGKIGIPGSVLNKPARLTSAEFIMIKAHPVVSVEIVGRIEALAPIVPIIRHHHEWYDGKGYPDGLKGEEIPLGARILAVGDGFEAMTSDRPYRLGMSEQEALAELQEGAGTQWDAKIVKVFCGILDQGGILQGKVDDSQ